MGELKATTSGEIRTRHDLLGYWWYEKSEADKVIAELEESHKKEVGQLLILKRKQANAANRLRDSMEQALCHQKYKRCLDNAWWCRKVSNAYAWSASTHRGWKIARYYDEKAELYRKWHPRWLKIAEKFKPNDEAK